MNMSEFKFFIDTILKHASGISERVFNQFCLFCFQEGTGERNSETTEQFYSGMLSLFKSEYVQSRAHVPAIRLPKRPSKECGLPYTCK